MKRLFIILSFCLFFTLGSCIRENDKGSNQLEGSPELLIRVVGKKDSIGQKNLNNQDLKSEDLSVGMDRLKIEDAISFSKSKIWIPTLLFL